ncbi:universal stress protein [Streptomyces bottropensis]|uniref:universal stress protein n=1 Tax=Streptomyces bottropensis TaxID=42235 RepID=UPI0036967FAC
MTGGDHPADREAGGHHGGPRPRLEGAPHRGHAVGASGGNAGAHLEDASHAASPIVVGLRNRTGSLGSHIGPVARTVLRHAVAPVAVVPHD